MSSAPDDSGMPSVNSLVNSGSVNISWRMVAFINSLIAAGSTGTLAIVVPVKDIDSLSTIALALAILAFVIQIIVFVVQSWTSGQQMLQSQAINADTRSLLTELKESATSTHQLLANQYDKILERLLLTTQRAVSETDQTESVDLDELRNRLERDLRAELAKELAPVTSQGHATFTNRQQSVFIGEQRYELDRLERFPKAKSEIERSLNALEPLSDHALATLARFGRDAIHRVGEKKRSDYEGFYRKDIESAVAELESCDLISIAPKSGSMRSATEDRFVLTPRGRTVVRLLTAIGPPPIQYETEILRIRKRARSKAKSQAVN